MQNLFHSVSLNVNNPHFLIMQGRITKARPFASAIPCLTKTSITRACSLTMSCLSRDALAERGLAGPRC